MFKKAIILAALSVSGFCGLVVFFMWFISAPPTLPKAGKVSTEQNKTGVVKEAYLVQSDGSFLHEYVCAKSSVFKIVKEEGKAKFTENLEGISAVLEDRVSQGGTLVKQIRSFQAQNGTWDYALQRLIAQGASVSVVESQASGLKPVFQGQAEKLDIQLLEGKPVFTISGFKAKLNQR